MKPAKKANQSNAMRPLIKATAAVGAIGAVILPLYNLFLHGPRDASSIVGRGSAYFEAHLIGGIASLLVIFGLIAIYLTHGKRMGKFGLYAFMLALFAQGAWAAILFVDGIFNPLLAHFDPLLQTHLHSADFNQTAGHDYLATLFGPSLHIFNGMSLLYAVGFISFGAAIIRAKVLPRSVGLLLAAGSVPLAVALMLPQWLETMGYAAIGVAVTWAGWLSWKRAAS